MAKFVKCVWMCELECLGMVLRSPVYCACRVVLMLYMYMELVGAPICSGMGGLDLHRLRLEIVSLAC